MDPALVIRRELPGDEQPTRALHEAAFGVPEGADRCAEVEILDRLRADGDVLDSLTFVAELHGEVVGHVVCSRARMGEGSAVEDQVATAGEPASSQQRMPSSRSFCQ